MGTEESWRRGLGFSYWGANIVFFQWSGDFGTPNSKPPGGVCFFGVFFMFLVANPTRRLRGFLGGQKTNSGRVVALVTAVFFSLFGESGTVNCWAILVSACGFSVSHIKNFCRGSKPSISIHTKKR